jgi:alkylation response protein AidB-like acyl-CoA dehydrogenase
MDFDFNEEQYAFRDSLRGVLGNRKSITGPGIPRLSEEATQRLWATLADLGVFALLVPEENGGLGLGYVDLALVLEEFGRELVPPLVIETLVATDLLIRHGSVQQNTALLPRIAAGGLKVSCAVAEANSGYDPADMSVSIADGTRDWRLNGVKILVPGAGSADYLLVAAKSPDQRPLVILLERGREGIELREEEALDHMSGYYEVRFLDVVASQGDLIGGALAAGAVRRLMDVSAASAATLLTGIAGKVMDATVEYVKQRHQFGKPIGSFQAIKHRCADIAVAVDSGRSSAYYAAWALTANTADQSKAVSIAKAFCGDMSRFVCNEGIQLHGGMGFTWDLGLHHYLRRAKLLEYSFGDASFHRQQVTREVLAERHSA